MLVIYTLVTRTRMDSCLKISVEGTLRQNMVKTRSLNSLYLEGFVTSINDDPVQTNDPLDIRVVDTFHLDFVVVVVFPFFDV